MSKANTCIQMPDKFIRYTYTSLLESRTKPECFQCTFYMYLHIMYTSEKGSVSMYCSTFLALRLITCFRCCNRESCSATSLAWVVQYSALLNMSSYREELTHGTTAANCYNWSQTIETKPHHFKGSTYIRFN